MTRSTNGKRAALIVGAVTLLYGCAGSDDPHDAGFFSGISGLSSGAYDQRLQERQQQLDTVSAQQQELHGKADAIKKNQDQIKASLNATEQEMADMQDNLAGLRAQLQDRVKTKKISEQRRADLEQQLTRLGHQVDLVQKSPTMSQADMQKELAILKERYDTLNEAMAAALK